MPVETSIVPTYIILQNLGLLREETRVIGYLLPGLVSPMYIFMFRAYFLGIPKELEEAAYMDGCGKLKAYFYSNCSLLQACICYCGDIRLHGSVE